MSEPFTFSRLHVVHGVMIDILEIYGRNGEMYSVELEHGERGHSIAEKLRQLARVLDTDVMIHDPNWMCRIEAEEPKHGVGVCISCGHLLDPTTELCTATGCVLNPKTRTAY